MLWLAVEANRDGTGLTSGRVGVIRLSKLARNHQGERKHKVDLKC